MRKTLLAGLMLGILNIGYAQQRIDVNITKDSLLVGDSSQVKATPRKPNGAIDNTAKLAWESSPSGSLIIRSTVNNGWTAMVTAQTAGQAYAVAVWKLNNGKFVRDSDKVVIKSLAPPPDTIVPPDTGVAGVSAQLVNIAAAKCLAANETFLIVLQCSKTDTTQAFNIKPVGKTGPLSVFNGSKCATATSDSTVDVASCNNATNQNWTQDSFAQIKSATNGKCISWSPSTGNIVLYSCGGESWQGWGIEPLSSGGGGGGGPTPPNQNCVKDTLGVSPRPNEPTGMTLLHFHSGKILQPCGWFNAVGQISIVDDTEKGKVLQLAMIPNTTPGIGTARIDSDREISSFGATKIYISTWEKLSPNFKGNNGGGGLKNVIVHAQSTYTGLPNGGFHVPGLFNNPANVDGRVTPDASLINFVAHDGINLLEANNITYYLADVGEPNYPGDLFSRGKWHQLEAIYETNSTGQANGSVKIWVDGRLVPPASYTALYADGLVGNGIKALYDYTLRITGIELTNVWGGGGTEIRNVDNYYRFKDFYVSGGFARTGERPDHWVLTSREGISVTVGSDVHITAQLVDMNGNPVEICGLQPTLTITNGATWEYWGATATDANLTCEHGRQFFTVHTSRSTNIQHVITATDFSMINNGQNGEARTGTLVVTTKP